jgi:hypothetical protein
LGTSFFAWDLLMKTLLFTCIAAVCATAHSVPMVKNCEKIPPWYVLSSPVRVSHVERQEMAKLPEMLKFRSDFPRVPFGFANAEWTAFKSMIRPGDKVVEFTSDSRAWQHSAGESGYALIRTGCLVNTFVTMRN